MLPRWLLPQQVQAAQQAAAASRLNLPSSSTSITQIVLPFKPELLAQHITSSAPDGSAAAAEDARALRHKFADVQPALLLFLQRLRCIAITDAVEPALSSVMARRQLAPGLLELSSGLQGQQRSRWLLVEKEVVPAVARLGVQLPSTKLALGFCLEGREPGQQPVFAYLPLRR